jgi:hypothetical protein
MQDNSSNPDFESEPGFAQAARDIIAFSWPPAVVGRIEELGRKSNEGTLTDEERDEYRLFVDAGDIIALLKAKARRVIDD